MFNTDTNYKHKASVPIITMLKSIEELGLELIHAPKQISQSIQFHYLLLVYSIEVEIYLTNALNQ